jgi:hypothetical protein
LDLLERVDASLVPSVANNVILAHKTRRENGGKLAVRFRSGHRAK